MEGLNQGHPGVLKRFVAIVCISNIVLGLALPSRLFAANSGADDSPLQPLTSQETRTSELLPSTDATLQSAENRGDESKYSSDDSSRDAGSSAKRLLQFAVPVLILLGFLLFLFRRLIGIPQYANDRNRENLGVPQQARAPELSYRREQTLTRDRPKNAHATRTPVMRKQVSDIQGKGISNSSVGRTAVSPRDVNEPEHSEKRSRPTLAAVGLSIGQDSTSVSDNDSERNIVTPPQIGEKSSFAKRNWWDPMVEWCQLTTPGMTGDATCDIGTFGACAVAAVSLRGNKHKLDAKPCQDAFAVQSASDKSGSQFLVAVLCDGMSSARYSHYGARRTAQFLAHMLCRLITEADCIDSAYVSANLESVLDSCRQKLMPLESELFGASGVDLSNVDLSDFNTTLTFLIKNTADDPDNNRAIVGSIGDSPVFILNQAEGSWEKVGFSNGPDDLINPATAAFPAATSFVIDEVEVRKDAVLVAMSDGVGNFLSANGRQTLLGDYLAEQWSTPVNMSTFINDVSFDLKSADDDRTVIAVWQRTK